MMEELKYEKINPKAKPLMLLGDIIGCTVLTATMLVLRHFFLRNITGTIWAVLIAIVLAIVWIVELISLWIRYARLKYSFNDREIRIRKGFLIIEETVIPIERLQQIALTTGPLDAVFGLTRVNLVTAGGETDVRFLEKDRADEIVGRLRDRINLIARQKREEIDG